MAAIKISPSFASTEGQKAELLAAAAKLPEAWSVTITPLEGQDEFRVSLDGGEDGAWNTTFFTSQVPLAVSWLRGFTPARRQGDSPVR